MGTPNPYADLPGHAPAVGVPLWRVYQTSAPVTGSARGPWYFASSDDARLPNKRGRFDVPTPHGTCYLGDDAAAAYHEHFGALLVPPAEEARRALASASPTRDVRFGDLAHPDAEFLGVSLVEAVYRTRSSTQRIARQVKDAGFEGVRTVRRSDPSGRTHTLSLFGAAGAHTPPGWDTEEGLPLIRPRPSTAIPRTLPLATPTVTRRGKGRR